MSISNERLVLSGLVQNEDYTRKVIAFIKPEYFKDEAEQRVYNHINQYIQKYNHAPNISTLKVMLGNDQTITEAQTSESVAVVDDIFDIVPPTSLDWMIKTTEEFCQERAVFNAIQRSIAIYQKEETKVTTAAIPDILQEAIAVCFDNTIGSDYWEDAEARWDYYNNPETRIAFGMQIFNEVTCGGVTRKTLNYLVAGINVGKTLGLVSLSCDYMRLSLNVLYFSMEMSEKEIERRIDANMMKTAANDIVTLGKERFMSRVAALKSKSYGRFKVKEFAPGSASALDFQRVLDDLKIKQGFVPDIIMIDYTQITKSSRLSMNAGSYFYYKAVAEELRALAVNNNAVVWSAAQFNRGNMAATEVDMDGIAESVGIAMTADGMWALMRTEELDGVGQLLVKQLKSRYANKAVRMRFTIGVDIDKQTFFDVNQSEQSNIVQPEQIKPMSGRDIKQKFLDAGLS